MRRLAAIALRLAQSKEDREAACRLRFRVFNIELGEGLESSYKTGLDTDRFDDRLRTSAGGRQVEDNPGRRIVGTYRMQSGETAKRNLGYYSEQEFSFAPYEPLRPGILELGRASIDREHRTPEVLTLLWRGIAQYANDMGLRYLIGCSSLTSKIRPKAGRYIANWSTTGFRLSLRQRQPPRTPALTSRRAHIHSRRPLRGSELAGSSHGWIGSHVAAESCNEDDRAGERSEAAEDLSRHRRAHWRRRRRGTGNSAPSTS